MKDSSSERVITGMNRFLVAFLALCILSTPFEVGATYRDEVAAWVPWFGGETAARAAERQLDELDILYLFVFEVGADGSLVAKVDLDQGRWEDLLEEAEDERVEVIPTIAWFEPAEIHAVLSDSSVRKRHIAAIEDLVDEYDFAGVDIDYERKWARTSDYFIAFLDELEDALGRDDLVCTLEARTPPEDLYRTIPDPLEYANDYRGIDRYCDRVQIMAYDQQRADISLNNRRRGVPYAPVADEDWVEKVLELALEDIDADKVFLGIPTYGRAWDVTVAPEWYRDYESVAALNHDRIIELAEKYDADIGRTKGGEAVITYFPDDSPFFAFNRLTPPKDTPKGYEAAAVALYIATMTGIEIPVRFVVWSDAAAVEEKTEIADYFELEGVSLFKLDGEEDPDIWDLF